MLKRIYTVAFFAAFAIAAWLVAIQRQETLRASIPLENRTAMVQISSNRGQAPSQSTAQRARITPLPGEIFLKTIDLNLDDDEDFEQIIIAKESAASSALSLSVADFAPSLGIYTRAFDGNIAATKLESIIVQPTDVTGDGLSDIVVQGLDSSNNQTLTIFRRLPGRSFSRAFSQAGKSVSLRESTGVDRPGAASIVVRKPSAALGMLDETLYTWSERFSAFEKTMQASVKDSETGFTGIEGSDAQTFEKWLNRLWARTGTPSDIRQFFLNLNDNELIFGDAQLQQRWIIKSANRNGNRLYLTCSTSESSDLDRVVTIDAKSRDTIAIGIIDQQVSHFRRDEGWSGLYTIWTQTEASASASLAAPLPAPPGAAAPDQRSLYGRYLGDNDSVFVCGEEKSVLVLNREYFEGVSRLYQYSGTAVLDFQQVLPSGLTGRRLTFVASVELNSDGSVRRLRLDPAHIGPDGIQIDYRAPSLFTKTS